jgi:hypothetical protein
MLALHRDPEILELLSRDPRADGKHPFQAAMDDCLMITIKGVAAGMQNTGCGRSARPARQQPPAAAASAAQHTRAELQRPAAWRLPRPQRAVCAAHAALTWRVGARVPRRGARRCGPGCEGG